LYDRTVATALGFFACPMAAIVNNIGSRLMKTKSSLHFILMIALLLVAAEPEQQLSARSADAEDRQLHRHRRIFKPGRLRHGEHGSDRR
jgi:hypothetical protein